MATPSTIKDCMRRNPLTISCDDNLVQAVETLMEYRLTGVTVVDADGAPVGVLSELDCIKSVLNAIYNDGDPEHALVRDAMTCDIVSCGPQREHSRGGGGYVGLASAPAPRYREWQISGAGQL